MSGLIRLVYVSRAAFQPSPSAQGIEPTVGRILLQSRRNNPQHQIGGVLYYGDGFFFQCLEGASDVVNSLMAKIMRDERHNDVEILKVSPIETRLFRNWSMKYIPLERDVRELLDQHGQAEFNPYEFSDQLLDALVELFVRVANPGDKPDQNYQDTQNEKPSFWRRILGIFGSGN